MNGVMSSSTTARADARLRRPAALLALLVLAVLSLSGCFKLDMSLEISPDNTVDGSIILAVNRAQADLFGGEDALREALSGEGSGLINDAPESGSVTTRDYEDDDWIGNEYLFSAVSLDEFSGADTGDLSITREGETFVVEGTLDLSQGADADPAAGALLDSAETEISITFPGDVQSSNGVEDGNTVTWSPKAGEVTQLSAVGSAKAGLPWSLIIAVVALLALIVIGVVLLLVVRGRQQVAASVPGPLPEGSIVPAGSDEPPPPPAP
jgi:LppM domain